MLNAQLLVPGEDPTQLEALHAEYHDSCKPIGPLETHAVETMIDAKWKLRRFSRIENGTYRLYAITLKTELAELPDEPDLRLAFMLHYDATHTKMLKHIAQQQARLSRLYSQSLGDLQKLQAARENKETDARAEAAIIATLNTGNNVALLPPDLHPSLLTKQTQSPETPLRS